jgi:hypothetical protein
MSAWEKLRHGGRWAASSVGSRQWPSVRKVVFAMAAVQPRAGPSEQHGRQRQTQAQAQARHGGREEVRQQGAASALGELPVSSFSNRRSPLDAWWCAWPIAAGAGASPGSVNLHPRPKGTDGSARTRPKAGSENVWTVPQWRAADRPRPHPLLCGATLGCAAHHRGRLRVRYHIASRAGGRSQRAAASPACVRRHLKHSGGRDPDRVHLLHPTRPEPSKCLPSPLRMDERPSALPGYCRRLFARLYPRINIRAIWCRLPRVELSAAPGPAVRLPRRWFHLCCAADHRVSSPRAGSIDLTGRPHTGKRGSTTPHRAHRLRC